MVLNSFIHVCMSNTALCRHTNIYICIYKRSSNWFELVLSSILAISHTQCIWHSIWHKSWCLSLYTGKSVVAFNECLHQFTQSSRRTLFLSNSLFYFLCALISLQTHKWFNFICGHTCKTNWILLIPFIWSFQLKLILFVGHNWPDWMQYN